VSMVSAGLTLDAGSSFATVSFFARGFLPRFAGSSFATVSFFARGFLPRLTGEVAGASG